MDLKEADIIGPDPLGHWYYKSKAQAMALTRIGLDLKTVIDQMREQVQNVE